MNSVDILSAPPPKADLRVSYGRDANQFIDLRLPKANLPNTVNGIPKPDSRIPKPDALHPLAINIHGGYWRAKYDLLHTGHLCAALTAKGIATANVEYRRVGNPGGGWPGTFEDIRAAYRFLLQNAEQYGFDAKHVVVMGHSAGGQLALCLAAHEPEVTRAVSLAGVVDLQQAYKLHLSNDAVVEFLGGTPSQVADHYREADPIALKVKAKQWLVHGTVDDTVPFAFSKDYVDAKQKAKEDARLVEIAGAGHFDLIDPRSTAWKSVESAVMEAVG